MNRIDIYKDIIAAGIAITVGIAGAVSIELSEPNVKRDDCRKLALVSRQMYGKSQNNSTPAYHDALEECLNNQDNQR